MMVGDVIEILNSGKVGIITYIPNHTDSLIYYEDIDPLYKGLIYWSGRLNIRVIETKLSIDRGYRLKQLGI